MNYKQFKQKTIKHTDSWTDVLIFNHFSIPLAFITYKLSQHKSIPYIFTIITFLIRCMAGFFFFLNHIYLAVLFIFLAYITDDMDGQLSRAIFGKDPQLRGTLDFILDNSSVILIYLGLSFIIPNPFMILFLFCITSHIFLMALTSTKFRLQAIQKINPLKPLTSCMNNIQKKFKKFGLILHPCIVESNFTLWILFPLFPSIYIISLALVFMWIDILASLVSVYYNLKRTGDE